MSNISKINLCSRLVDAVIEYGAMCAKRDNEDILSKFSVIIDLLEELYPRYNFRDYPVTERDATK